MKKYIVIVCVLFSFISFAHQSKTSSTVLEEKENNVWVVQISASLTDFQHEIKAHFNNTPSTPPNTFQKMVLAHIKRNLSLHYNGDFQVKLKNGVVQLGQETKATFEVDGLPQDLKTIEITNTVFKDITSNENTVTVIKDNFDKDLFVLNNENNYTLLLTINNNKFIPSVAQDAGFLSILLFAIFGFGFLVQLHLLNKHSAVPLS